MKKITWIAVACLMAGLPAVSYGDLITNGSFETGVNAPTSGFRTLNVNNTDIDGWKVGANSVDWIGDYWQAADGARSLDLSGTAQGLMIGQTLTLDLNTTYVLTFAMAGNPDGGPAVKEMRVWLNGTNITQDFAFDVTGKSKGNMGWAYQSWEFTPTVEENTLWLFSINTPGGWGPAIDDVKLVAVPAPAAPLLVCLGLGLVGWIKRRVA